jgi:hypothetical protein
LHDQLLIEIIEEEATHINQPLWKRQSKAALISCRPYKNKKPHKAAFCNTHETLSA